MRKKLIATMMMAALLCSTLISTTSAADSSRFDLSVPAGYEVIPSKNFMRTVDEPNIFKVVDLSDAGSDNVAVVSNDSLITKVESQMTYFLQDLRNLKTSEVISQYATEAILYAADPPSSNADNGQDSKKLVRMFITIYYTKEAKEDKYITLDKVSWRYEHTDQARVIKSSKTYYQNGPGFAGPAVTQEKTIPEFGTSNPSDVPKIMSGTVMARDWGWTSVLQGGLATKMGMVSDNTVAKVSTPSETWGWRFGLLIEGTYPTWPD